MQHHITSMYIIQVTAPTNRQIDCDNESQGYHSDIIFNEGGGGGGWLTEVHILYSKKSQLHNLSTQEIPIFLAYPRKFHTSSNTKSTIPKKFGFLWPKKTPLLS